MNNKESQNKMKDIYIVGTGIAGSLIAKTLTDCVFKGKTIITRLQANKEFKQKLIEIKYITNISNNEVDLESLVKDDVINEILDRIKNDFKKEPVGDENLYIQNKFEQYYFEHFYQEISIELLEAGLNDGVKLDSSKNFEVYSSYMERFNMASYKVPNSPYPEVLEADSPNVLQLKKIPEKNNIPAFPAFPVYDKIENENQSGPINNAEGNDNLYLIQKGPLQFLSDHIRVGGGTTMHWLGTTPRMLPNDFDIFKNSNRLNKEYYKWPINYEDLKPYYELAEYEIGVSGEVSKQVYPEVSNDIIYGADYVFPMQEIPQSYMDLEIDKGLKGEKVKLGNTEYPILLTSTPQGRNSIPNDNYKKVANLQEFKTEFDKPIHGKVGINYKLYLDEDKVAYKALGAVWNPYMGERCEGNGSCVPICPVQAKYNALKSLKRAFYKIDWKGQLQKNNHITVRAQTVVSSLTVGESGAISRINTRIYEPNVESSYKDDPIDTQNSIVILAASALENPKILLNSKYTNEEGVEKTVANISDQVGRNLMDHQVMLTWGLADKPVYPFRGPGSTTNISTFRDGSFRNEHAAWIAPLDNWGWGWPTFAPGSDLEEFLAKGLFGKELRNAIEDRVTRQVLFHFEIEQLPDPKNRITIDEKYTDRLGIPKPVIHYSISEYEAKALEKAKEVSNKLFELLDYEDKTKHESTHESTIKYNGKVYNFNGAGHIVGTHRMGSDPETSVTNSYSQSWDHKNLYIVGAGSMPTLGTSNPTLTLAALAIRSCESILTDLTNKKNETIY